MVVPYADEIRQILEVLETIGLRSVIAGENAYVKILLLGQRHCLSFHIQLLLDTNGFRVPQEVWRMSYS